MFITANGFIDAYQIGLFDNDKRIIDQEKTPSNYKGMMPQDYRKFLEVVAKWYQKYTVEQNIKLAVGSNNREKCQQYNRILSRYYDLGEYRYGGHLFEIISKK